MKIDMRGKCRKPKYPTHMICATGDIISRYGKVLKHSDSLGGKYKTVRLDGRNQYVHRLLAEEFIPNPEGKPEVNHKDGNGCNNRLDNLEWVTKSEQGKHAWSLIVPQLRKRS